MSKARTPRFSPEGVKNSLEHDEPNGFLPVSVSSTESTKSLEILPRHISDAEARNMFLNEEVMRLNQRIRELEKEAEIDPVIDVFTRRAFMRELDRARAMNARYDIPSAIIVFHLDGLTEFIEQYGRGISDALLLKVREVFRTDVRHCDTVARLGQDEFGVILFKTEFDIARTKSSALNEKITQIVTSQNSKPPKTHKLVTIKLSWGVAPCDSDQTAQQILSRADRAKTDNALNE